jgi:uncharacterized RDD family membrane protein YckC
MNKARYPFLSFCWLALALAVWPALRAQETPPAAPPADSVAPAAPASPAKSAATPPEQPAEAAPASEEKAVPADKKEKDTGELRDLSEDGEKPAAPSKKGRTRNSGNHRAIKPEIGDHTVSAGNTQSQAVSFAGDTTVDGHITDAAVSIMGSTTVNGTVDDAAVSIFGTTTVKGHVKGEAVAVFGDVILGPDAIVDGEVVAVMGKVIREPGSQVHGGVQQVGGHRLGPAGDFRGLRTYFEQCVLWVRPLAFDSGLWWAWAIAFGFLVFYAFIALLAPTGVNKCIETLEQRPGYSLLSALLTMLLTPVGFILLALTMFIAIGFVLIPLFALGLFFTAIFGKIVILAWLGRRITRLAGDSTLAHPVFGVLIGGVIVLALYTIPFAGFIIYKLMGILGLGVVVYTLIRHIAANRPPKPAPVATAAAVPPAMGDATPTAMPPVLLPSVISAATLPRVGFWLRFAASLLDAILVGMVCGFLSNMWHGFGVFPFWFALYCVIMWATKGTTIGGIICSLKLVRVDDRPIDWSVAIVRGLAGFLSLFVAGLGFIWVAFDDDKQSWHDKIAGTTIVRVPKGTALL